MSSEYRLQNISQLKDEKKLNPNKQIQLLKFKLITFLISFICCILVIIVFFVKVFGFYSGVSQGYYHFSGTAQNIWTSDDGKFFYITLENISLEDKNVNGKLLLGVTFLDGEQSTIKIGYRLNCKGILSHTPISGETNSGLDTQAINQDVRFFSSISASDLSITQQAPSSLKWLQQQIINIYNIYLSPTNAAIAIAMVLGDTAYLDANTNSIFVNSGIVHILSVSGFHLAVLVTFVGWVMRKLKASRIINFIITTIILLGFSFLANMVVGVVRSFIMATTLGVSKLMGRRYDQMSSMCLAASIILIISPLMLFHTSFLLSFDSVLSIILFNSQCQKLLQKIKIKDRRLPKKFTDAFAIILAVQIITIPLTVVLLKQFATYATISNLLFLPILTILFIVILILTPLVLLIPFSGHLLGLLNFPLNAIMFVLEQVANFPFANVRVNSSTILIIILLTSIVGVSRFILIKRSNKIIIPIVSILYLFVMLSGISFQNPLIAYSIIPLPNNNTIVSTEDTKIAFAAPSNVRTFLKELESRKIFSIESMFLTNDIFMLPSDYNYLARILNIKQFIVPYTMDTEFVIQLSRTQKVDILLSVEHKQVDSLDISLLVDDNVFMGYNIKTLSNILITSKHNLPLSNNIIDSVDIVRSSSSRNYQGVIQIVDYAYHYDEFIFSLYQNKNFYFDYKNYRIGEIINN